MRALGAERQKAPLGPRTRRQRMPSRSVQLQQFSLVLNQGSCPLGGQVQTKSPGRARAASRARRCEGLPLGGRARGQNITQRTQAHNPSEERNTWYRPAYRAIQARKEQVRTRKLEGRPLASAGLGGPAGRARRFQGCSGRTRAQQGAVPVWRAGVAVVWSGGAGTSVRACALGMDGA